jgi:UDP:flavonoid glycosyltransferase YjiC (YdhE family)
VRVLLTSAPAGGHFNRVAPLARAAAAAGHDVAFAGSPRFAEELASQGIRHYAAGLEAFPETTLTDEAARLAWLSREALPELAAAHFRDLLPVVEDFRPDVLVRDFTEQAGGSIAAVFDLPCVSVASCSPHALMETYADTLRSTNLLGAVPPARASSRHLCFHPPEFHGAAATFPPVARFVRHDNDGVDGHTAAAEILDRLDPGLPLVLVAVGTVVSEEYPDVVTRFTDVLREERMRVVVLAGGPRPEVHEIAENRLVAIDGPQQALVGYADAVVTHGGFNSVIEALSAGVPLVIGPITSDAFYSAARCRELGVGVAVDLAGSAPGAIRTALRAVLDDASYRANARGLAARNASLPDVASAVREITDLVSRRST